MNKLGIISRLFSKSVLGSLPAKNWPKKILLPFPHNSKFLIILPFDEKFYKKCDLFLHPNLNSDVCRQRGFELINYWSAGQLLSSDILDYLCPGAKETPIALSALGAELELILGRKTPKIILLQYSESADGFVYYDLSDCTPDLIGFNVEKIIYSIPWLKEPGKEDTIRYRMPHKKSEDDEVLFAKSPKTDSAKEESTIRFSRIEDNDDVGIRFRITGPDYKTNDYIVEDIASKNESIIKEFIKKYEQLREIGISDEFLQSLLNFKRKASRLRITSLGRIFLIDYDNKEVKMDALSKAVYFLYLRHPEGIRFKSLVDYRGELFQIYSKLSNRSDLEALRASVERLTDPEDNSINEKTTKANKAFQAVIEEASARVYYIDGLKGEDKSISLDRTLVIWE